MTMYPMFSCANRANLTKTCFGENDSINLVLIVVAPESDWLA